MRSKAPRVEVSCQARRKYGARWFQRLMAKQKTVKNLDSVHVPFSKLSNIFVIFLSHSCARYLLRTVLLLTAICGWAVTFIVLSIHLSVRGSFTCAKHRWKTGIAIFMHFRLVI